MLRSGSGCEDGDATMDSGDGGGGLTIIESGVPHPYLQSRTASLVATA